MRTAGGRGRIVEYGRRLIGCHATQLGATERRYRAQIPERLAYQKAEHQEWNRRRSGCRQ